MPSMLPIRQDDDAMPSTMMPPPQMAPGMIQHPMHAMIAPIGAPPPDLPPMSMSGSPPDISGMSQKPTVAKKMSPLEEEEQHEEQRLMGDYKKDADPYGSPDNHPGILGKFLHGLSVATGGSGRRQMEEGQIGKQLETTDEARSKDDLESATAAHTEAETPEVAPNAESTRNLQGAEADKDTADANAAGQGKPVETSAGLLVVKPDGSAQRVMVDGKPVGPIMKTEVKQIEVGGKPHQVLINSETGDQLRDLGETGEKPPNVSVNTGEKNLWSVPQSDGSHKVVSLKAGDTIPTGAVSLSGQSTENSKAGAADAPTVDALKFANDYLDSGAFTGPSDEALQDQFFQMAKPSTGFRMNQAQISQLHDMASWMDSWKGRAYHAINGTWFAPEQRQQIVQTMNDLAKSKGIGQTPQGGAQMIRARDPQGVLHEAPAGTALPAGWKAQ
jgi:hypothetical protein